MDRFKDIEAFLDSPLGGPPREYGIAMLDKLKWARCEIRRLRRIEDAAITACADGGGDVIELERVVQANLRPGMKISS